MFSFEGVHMVTSGRRRLELLLQVLLWAAGLQMRRGMQMLLSGPGDPSSSQPARTTTFTWQPDQRDSWIWRKLDPGRGAGLRSKSVRIQMRWSGRNLTHSLTLILTQTQSWLSEEARMRKQEVREVKHESAPALELSLDRLAPLARPLQHSQRKSDSVLRKQRLILIRVNVEEKTVRYILYAFLIYEAF